MAHYYKDDHGQWWYTWGMYDEYRQRAYSYYCEECGDEFRGRHKPEKPARFCGKVCSGKWQYKHGIHNASAKGEHSPHWKGGVKRSRNGALLIYMPDHPNASDDYVFLHRLIMEDLIGRLLKPDELVHHIDKNSANNVPSNLQIVSASEHAKIHNKDRVRNKFGQFSGNNKNS